MDLIDFGFLERPKGRGIRPKGIKCIKRHNKLVELLASSCFYYA
jgi:hypothetical protein